MEQMNDKMKEDIKKELLIMAENCSKDAVEGVFKIAEVAIKDSENKVDDMLIGCLPVLKNLVLKYVDEISKDV